MKKKKAQRTVKENKSTEIKVELLQSILSLKKNVGSIKKGLKFSVYLPALMWWSERAAHPSTANPTNIQAAHAQHLLPCTGHPLQQLFLQFLKDKVPVFLPSFLLLLPSPKSASGDCAWLSVQTDFVHWNRTLDKLKSLHPAALSFASPSQGHSWPPANQHKLEGFYKVSKFSEHPFLSCPSITWTEQLGTAQSAMAWGQAPGRLKTERAWHSEEMWDTKSAPRICCLWFLVHSEPNTASYVQTAPNSGVENEPSLCPASCRQFSLPSTPWLFIQCCVCPEEAKGGINIKLTVKRKQLTAGERSSPSPLTSAQNHCMRLPDCGTSMEPALAVPGVPHTRHQCPNQPGSGSSALPQLLSCSVTCDISQFSPTIPYPSEILLKPRGTAGCGTQRRARARGSGTGTGDSRAAGTIPFCCLVHRGWRLLWHFPGKIFPGISDHAPSWGGEAASQHSGLHAN